MQFTPNYETGTVTVDGWDNEIIFTDEFLAHAAKKFVRYEGDDIWIEVDNGNAHYRITKREPECARCAAILVEGRIIDGPTDG